MLYNVVYSLDSNVVQIVSSDLVDNITEHRMRDEELISRRGREPVDVILFSISEFSRVQ